MRRQHIDGFSASRKLRTYIAVILFILTCLTTSIRAHAQSAESLSGVKKVFLESFGQGESASKLRERFIKQLQKSGKLEVVATAAEADAVIKGTENIWVVGVLFDRLPRRVGNAAANHSRLFVRRTSREGQPTVVVLLGDSP